MKTKVSELIGPALDWMVAEAMGLDWGSLWSPSTRWEQGGPIITRERIHLTAGANDADWIADHPNAITRGLTPLIAAMRCYVTSRLGDEVDVPEELL